MSRAALVGWVLLGLAVVGAGATWWWFNGLMSRPVNPRGGAVEIVLEDGATFDRATELLMYQGVVPDPLLFELRARQRGKRVPLKAGRYKFDRSMSPDAIMDKLALGPDEPVGPLKLQIIPGENIWQIAEKLDRLGVPGDLLALDAEISFNELGIPAPSKPRPGAHTRLEGYLHPDTYHLDRKRPQLNTAIRQAIRQFNRVWGELKQSHATRYRALRQQHQLSDHDLVILASLVEKEVAALEEATSVAAVFYNRLRRGIPLQTDPTMVYGPTTWREKPSPTFRRDATNPYNTYHAKRLPPGPICNPGRAALEAVLQPAQTDALYFVAMRDGTGRHAFARTLDEHRRNIDRYLKPPRSAESPR